MKKTTLLAFPAASGFDLDAQSHAAINTITNELIDLRAAAIWAEDCWRRAVMLAPGETRDAELCEVRRRCKHVANALREINRAGFTAAPL